MDGRGCRGNYLGGPTRCGNHSCYYTLHERYCPRVHAYEPHIVSTTMKVPFQPAPTNLHDCRCKTLPIEQIVLQPHSTSKRWKSARLAIEFTRASIGAESMLLPAQSSRLLCIRKS